MDPYGENDEQKEEQLRQKIRETRDEVHRRKDQIKALGVKVDAAEAGVKRRITEKEKGDRIEGRESEFQRIVRQGTSNPVSLAGADVQIDLECRGHLGETPLHYLAVEGYSEAVIALLERGANPDPRNELDNTPLVECVVLGHLDIVEALLKAGADPNVDSDEFDSPLVAASDSGQVEAVRLLLEYGANPHSVTTDGRTAIGEALAGGHAEIAELLRAAGEGGAGGVPLLR